MAAVDATPTPEAPAELVGDTGYDSRDGLKALDDGPWKTRIAEHRTNGILRWRGDTDARRAVRAGRLNILVNRSRTASSFIRAGLRST